MFIPAAVVPGEPTNPLAFDTGMPGIPIPVRSIMIADVILVSFGVLDIRSFRQSPHEVHRSTP